MPYFARGFYYIFCSRSILDMATLYQRWLGSKQRGNEQRPATWRLRPIARSYCCDTYFWYEYLPIAVPYSFCMLEVSNPLGSSTRKVTKLTGEVFLIYCVALIPPRNSLSPPRGVPEYHGTACCMVVEHANIHPRRGSNLHLVFYSHFVKENNLFIICDSDQW